MKVTVKDLAATIELKNNGIEFEVRDNDGRHVGDLVITKAKVIWCKGKTDRKNGHALSFDKFIQLMEQR
jgi:hypothetical protein